MGKRGLQVYVHRPTRCHEPFVLVQYVYLCMYVCMYVRTDANMQAFMDGCMYRCTSMRVVCMYIVSVRRYVRTYLGR